MSSTTKENTTPTIAAIRYLRLNDGRVAFGVMEELENSWLVTGAYMASNTQIGEAVNPATGKVHNAVQAHRSIEQFSPLKPISTIHIPKTKIDGEIVDMPRHVSLMLINVWDAESRNVAMRERLLNMPVVARSGLSPEEHLALVAQHIHNKGALPQAVSTQVSSDMGTIGGVFNVKHTSPYRCSSDGA